MSTVDTDRYEVRKDGTVLDHDTNLVWESAAAVEARGVLPWQAAMDSAGVFGGGWRLPTITELMAVIDYARIDPATTMPGWGSGWYWSSSCAGDASNAWLVCFGGGSVRYYDKTHTYAVRCVRRGP